VASAAPEAEQPPGHRTLPVQCSTQASPSHTSSQETFGLGGPPSHPTGPAAPMSTGGDAMSRTEARSVADSELPMSAASIGVAADQTENHASAALWFPLMLQCPLSLT
jgi:hypothetical protein